MIWLDHEVRPLRYPVSDDFVNEESRMIIQNVGTNLHLATDKLAKAWHEFEPRQNKNDPEHDEYAEKVHDIVKNEQSGFATEFKREMNVA